MIDLKRIAEIEKDSFSIPWDEKVYIEMIENSRYHIITENVENDIAGFAILLEMVDVVELIRIAVKKELRNRGIGDKLLKDFLKRAKEIGYSEIFLEVREKNTSAINLYLKNGFEKIALRKAYYTDTGENAVIMKKHI